MTNAEQMLQEALGMDGRSITPARRLDAAPTELRASSTRQTITARPSTSARSSTEAGHARLRGLQQLTIREDGATLTR